MQEMLQVPGFPSLTHFKTSTLGCLLNCERNINEVGATAKHLFSSGRPGYLGIEPKGVTLDYR